MVLEAWHLWIIIAVLLLIIEIFSPTFLAACLAIGCLFSGLFAFLDFNVKIQIIVFSAGTLVSFFAIRPFMLRYAYKKSKHIKTNVDAIVGKIGRVIIKIDNAKNEGRVIIDGDDWKAESENDLSINVGEKVEVVKINSTILTVKPLKKED